MPLSEHEQKLLEQMERALYAEDPKFASQMKGRHHGPSRKRRLIGLVVAILGLACVVAGVSFELIWLGGVGFAIMVAGVAWAFGGGGSGEGTELTDTSTGRTRRIGKPRGKRGQKKDGHGGGSTGFMQRMENRWDERKRGDSL